MGSILKTYAAKGFAAAPDQGTFRGATKTPAARGERGLPNKYLSALTGESAATGLVAALGHGTFHGSTKTPAACGERGLPNQCLSALTGERERAVVCLKSGL